MSYPDKMPLQKQGSLSYIEQSLKIIPVPPQQAPVTIYPGPKAKNLNLSKADLEIADRLEKLRKNTVEELPTEEEMASRLAQLKGLPSDHYLKSSKVTYQPPDLRTDTEKSEDLIIQAMEESALHSKLPKPDDEIETRLSQLRGDSTHMKCNKESSSGQGTSQVQADCDEVTKLLLEAGVETEKAKASLDSLKEDKEIGVVLKEISKRRRAQKEAREVSYGEKYSGDDSSSTSSHLAKERKKGNDVEVEEVDRIVKLYTDKEKQRKEKRKAKALKRKKEENSDSSDESDTESDLVSSTSESEKISDSD